MRCVDVYVDPMSAAAPLINPVLASVVGLVVIVAVCLVIVAAFAKYCIRRRRRSKASTRFGRSSHHTGHSSSTGAWDQAHTGWGRGGGGGRGTGRP